VGRWSFFWTSSAGMLPFLPVSPTWLLLSFYSFETHCRSFFLGLRAFSLLMSHRTVLPPSCSDRYLSLPESAIGASSRLSQSCLCFLPHRTPFSLSAPLSSPLYPVSLFSFSFSFLCLLFVIRFPPFSQCRINLTLPPCLYEYFFLWSY